MRFPTFFDLMKPSVEAGMMLAEAQMVIGIRLAGMAGLWPMPARESVRMVTEKMAASQDLLQAVMMAGLRGASPAQVASVAIAPYRQRTRANAKRLTQG